MRLYDLKFFEELAQRNISPFSGSSIEAKRRAKQRLIKNGILPAQFVEQEGGRFSYWEIEQGVDLIGRAEFSFSLRKQGFRWRYILGKLIVLPIVEQVKKLPQPSIEITELSVSKIRATDWSRLVEPINWILETYDITHDTLNNLSESEKFEALFYIQAVLHWFLKDKLSLFDILAKLKKEVRGASAKQSDYAKLRSWINNKLGENALNDSGDVFLLAAIGENNILGETVISIFEDSIRRAGIPSQDNMVLIYNKMLNVARISIEHNQFNVEQLSKKFQEIWDARNI